MQPHNLLHNSAASRETTRSVALPTSRDTVAEYRVEELKAMITARGGGVTGRNGKAYSKEAMQRIVRAYLSMEKRKHSKHCVFQPCTRWQWYFCQDQHK